MSNERSERRDPADLPHLERDLPTSAADVAALRALRQSLPPGLVAPPLSDAEIRRLLEQRPTSEGWEPVTL